MTSNYCVTGAVNRRIFWTTQPDSCGTTDTDCSQGCGITGLQFNDADCRPTRCFCECPDAVHDPDCPAASARNTTEYGVTFATNDYVRSLLLNIFNTNARNPETLCGNLPGSQGGHWSENYIEGINDAYVGTKISQLGAFRSFRDALTAYTALIKTDAAKLITYGVATTVDVELSYDGTANIDAVIVATGLVAGDMTRVNMTATQLNNEWVWT